MGLEQTCGDWRTGKQGGSCLYGGSCLCIWKRFAPRVHGGEELKSAMITPSCVPWGVHVDRTGGSLRGISQRSISKAASVKA
jgi:hypothetical protein